MSRKEAIPEIYEISGIVAARLDPNDQSERGEKGRTRRAPRERVWGRGAADLVRKGQRLRALITEKWGFPGPGILDARYL
jgi:hypothetical protein